MVVALNVDAMLLEFMFNARHPATTFFEGFQISVVQGSH